MEPFDFCDTSLLSYFSKNQDLEKKSHLHNQLDQKSLVLSILQRGKSYFDKLTDKDPFQITKYDEKLADHLKRHQGWGAKAQKDWINIGALEPATKRIETLRKQGLLNRNYRVTAKFEQTLTQYKERANKREQVRANLVRQSRAKTAQQIVSGLTLEQTKLLTTLAEFRQVTVHQARISQEQMANLQKMGLVESKKVLVNQKQMAVLTLSQKQGKEVAHYGLGIKKPFTGIQQDQSKLSHDLSVIDAMEHAKAKFLSKGYQFIGAVSEHRLYGEKVNANSDLGQKYADAYLIFKDAGGDTCNVAIEFGNYAPGYLKDKLTGIDADQILIYTHDERRAQEYAQVVSNPNIEIHVIAPPYAQEIER